MGRFDGILICSDVDGTLAVGKEIPEKNLQALQYFQAEGGLFTLATGRPAGYENHFPLRYHVPLITDNGTRIYDVATGHTLWTFPLDGSGLLLEWLDRSSCVDVTLGFTDGYVKSSRGDVVASFLSHKTGELLKLVCHGFSDEAEAVAFQTEAQGTFGERYRIHRSWATGVEFVSPLGGKGECLSHLRTILGDSVHTVLAIGDYENDLPLLAAADRSFAPANACPSVLKAAQTVLPSWDEGALAALIEGLADEFK